MKIMANRHTVLRCSSDILVKDFGWWLCVLLQRATLLSQSIRHLRLSRRVHQFRTDGHVPELSVHHLFLGVRQTVLLFDGLVAGKDINEDQTDNQTDKRVLLSETFAAKQITVQPRLYMLCVCHSVV